MLFLQRGMTGRKNFKEGMGMCLTTGMNTSLGFMENSNIKFYIA